MAKRGRPAYRVTAENRERVEILVATGMSEESIARSIGIAPKTLRKYYRAQLDVGHDRRRASMIEAMYRSGIAGNVAAQKAFVALTDLAPPGAPRAPTTERRGKKEEAEIAATGAAENTGWKGLVH